MLQNKLDFSLTVLTGNHFFCNICKQTIALTALSYIGRGNSHKMYVYHENVIMHVFTWWSHATWVFMKLLYQTFHGNFSYISKCRRSNFLFQLQYLVPCDDFQREDHFILKHLAKSKYCQKSYSEKDTLDLRSLKRKNFDCSNSETKSTLWFWGKGPKGTKKMNKKSQKQPNKTISTLLLKKNQNLSNHQMRTFGRFLSSLKAFNT